MKKTGDERAVYPWHDSDNANPCEEVIHPWPSGKIDEAQVIIDTETGLAFTMNLCEGWTIPRFEVANLIDEGYEF